MRVASGDDASMTARCDACGTANPATSRFCGGCGSPLGVRCPSCGTPVQREFRFCGSCGSSVGGTTARGEGAAAAMAAARPAHDRSTDGPSGAPIAPVAERRHVSILFVDLVSFTSLAEGRDPEDVRDLLERYFATCRSIIARYGGVVEKFIGDAVMAMWGAPVAHEDDAERAVRAGLELVAAVATLGGELGLPGLQARAGVVSGEAAVTLGAVGQGMVAGDVVNTASRLESSAPPGSVLVDASTHRAASGSIAFESVGDRSLRGKQSPVQAWEARQVVALRLGGGRSELPEGPLVGRDSPIAIVKDLLHAVREERTVRLVSIFGQAGVGKSRLAWELEKYVDGVVEKILWHRAGSPAYGEALAFRALADMVRHRAGIFEGERPAVGRRRLATCLADYVADSATRDWIAPFMAALIGLGPAPRGEREEAFAAWRTFFERVAERGTTVLVFEDLHWADAGLLDFIEHLVERASARPILVVTVARPELLERRPDWGAGSRDHVRLSLDPLPRADMAELLGGLAPGLPTDLGERVLDRAEGIPLYAVEILRMLVDRGALEAVDGAYAVRGKLSELDVPESLHALVAARIDGLDPSDRALLRDAAVLGQSFGPEALAAIGGTGVVSIEPGLRRLVRRELLVQAAVDHGSGHERYRFAEWLVREVAYATLALRDRRTRHLAAGNYYESLDDPEVIGATATHLLAAYRLGSAGPDSAELAARAAAALSRAADHALALHSPDQALEFLEGALSLAVDDTERARLWDQAAISAQAAARLKVAEMYARKAIDWHTAHGDRSAVARTTAALGAILALGYETGASIAVVREAVEELGDDASLQDDPWLAELRAGLARSYLLAGRIPEAIEWVDRALTGAERLNLDPVIAGALATKGAARLEEGRTTEGIGLLRASLLMSERHGLVVPALRARNSLAAGLLAEDPRAALDTAETGLSIARRFGFRDLAIRLASNWLEAALDVGAWDDIVPLVAELLRVDLPLADRIDLEGASALVLTWRGDPAAAPRFAALDQLVVGLEPDVAVAILRERQSAALLALGRPVGALAHAEIATTLYRTSGLHTAFMWGAIPAARCALWAGDVERVVRTIDEIESSGLRGRSISAMLLTLRAGLDARRGDVTAAIDRYADAASEWRRLDVPLQLGLCDLEAASLLPAASAEAAAASDEARAVFEGLGAATLIARLETGLSIDSPVAVPPG